MENNNRLMPHIRRTTHIMKFAHRNSFDFRNLKDDEYSQLPGWSGLLHLQKANY